MKLLLLLACVMVSVWAEVSNSMFDPSLDEGWKSWKSFHKKQYEENNENDRRKIWEKSMKFITKHNLEHSIGKHTFTVGMNQFGDLTMKEFAQLLNKFNKKETGNSTYKAFTAQANTELPSFVDWRPKGYVTHVKDQGQCGSCWAFSTTGVLEGQVFKKTGKLISLSEQYLMDCSRDVGNHGCNGGYKVQSLLFIKEKGISSEQSYPYTAKPIPLDLLSYYDTGGGHSVHYVGTPGPIFPTPYPCIPTTSPSPDQQLPFGYSRPAGELVMDGDCKVNRNDNVATCKGVRIIPKNSETDLAAAVATVGPISVSLDAEHRSFMLYKSGIFYEPRCSSDKLDHEVLAVGYGTENEKPYWIVKNSWGTSWGMEGYVHMSKDMDNNCGIATDAIYPEV